MSPETDMPKGVETHELTPEDLKKCLQSLETDYRWGIVKIEEKGTVDSFKDALASDRTAGISWETIQTRLEANNNALLKRAAAMQGGGTLIGVFENGELCITDRGTEPVIFATTREGEQIIITTDTFDRDAVMQSIEKGGQFADYNEIRNRVIADGYALPSDAMDYVKRGIIAAKEAVTGQPFVQSNDGRKFRSAILDCGQVYSSARVRVVGFDPGHGSADVDDDFADNRDDGRGAVRVLRG